MYLEFILVFLTTQFIGFSLLVAQILFGVKGVLFISILYSMFIIINLLVMLLRKTIKK